MKTKKTLEKYFSESDRLKAIIDEQQGINIHRRGLMVSALDSTSRVPGSSPGRQSWERHSTVTMPLSTLGRVVGKPLNA